MGVPTSEVSYASATARRGDHEVHKGYVVAMGGGTFFTYKSFIMFWYCGENGIYILL
jgi:hypothetical protein